MKHKFPLRFFLIAFAWTWAIEIPLMLAGLGVIPSNAAVLEALRLPMTIIAAFGPGIAALYSMRGLEGKGSVKRYLKGLLDFRLGWRAWLFPILIFGGSSFIAWILPEAWGAPRIGMELTSMGLFPVYYLIMILFGGGQEELGWRGYILDPMEERLGMWWANLLLGVVWALWHLPLFFTPGASQAYMNFFGFIMLTVGCSFIFSWLRKISGKRILAGLFAHGTDNAFFVLFPTLVMKEGAFQIRYWIWVSLTLVIGIAIMSIRTYREKRAEIDMIGSWTASAKTQGWC